MNKFLVCLALFVSAQSARSQTINPCLSALNPTLAAIEDWFHPGLLTWENKIAVDGKLLTPGPLRDTHRARRLVQATYANDALMNETLEAVGFANQRDLQNFYAVYPRAYDRSVTSIDAYLAIVLKICESLALSGNILDLGGFTGNAAALCLRYPAPNKRKVSVYDLNSHAISLTESKLLSLGLIKGVQFEAEASDVTSPIVYAKPFVSAYMVNVAFLLSDEELGEVFKQTKNGLPKGGHFFVSDFLSRFVIHPRRQMRWIEENAVSAVTNLSTLSEFDIVFMAAMNRWVVKHKGVARTPSQIVALAKRFGLRAAQRQMVNFGEGIFLDFVPE